MAASKQQTRNEAPEMRRVRNQRIHTTNPSLLFARGVESLVSEHLQRPCYRDQDEAEEKRADARQKSRPNLFNLLMRQFAI
jgi:c-di-GMP-binding flagellar brake protein YcgR